MQRLGQCRPWQLDAGPPHRIGAGSDRRAQLHVWRHILQCHLDLHGAALRRHGGGDFTDKAVSLDLGVIQQADDDPSVAGRRHQQRFVDVEHRIAVAVTGQAEDRHGRLHHLAHLGLALGDHAIGIGHQRGVAQLLIGIGQLCLGSLERALVAAQRSFGGIVFALAGVALGQQFLLADKGRAGLGDPRLRREHLGLGRVDIVLQVFRVEPRQHLVGLDVVTDIDATGNDLAADAERQVGLHPRLHVAGQGDPGCEIGGLNLLHTHPRQGLGDLFLAAAGEQIQQPQANDRQWAHQRHAGSLLCAQMILGMRLSA